MRAPGERDGPRRVVIVGAGLAGLLAAAVLKPALRRAQWRIELVGPRPRSAGPAAVATGPDLTRLLRGAGVDEAVLMRRCAGTYRLASRFEDWFEAGTGHWLPLGPTGPRPNGLDLFHYWVRFALAGEGAGAYGDYALNARLAAQARGPSGPDGASPVAEAGDYGFHLDRDALLGFLRDLARAEGVRWTEGRVGGVERDAFGRVTALDLDDGRRVAGDLFLDCSGAAGRLIGTELGEPWLGEAAGERESLWLSLPPDPAWIPATAYRGLGAGWTARLPLADRTACRLVAGTGEAAALARSLGGEASGAAPLRTGHRAAPWRENVVAIGAAAGAVEPLAGLGLSLVLAAVGALIDYLPRGPVEAPLRRAYNARMGRLQAAARDAVALHYGLVRRPEPFWARGRAASLPDSLADRLDLYEAAGCIEEPPGAFDETAYLHTLAGAGHLPQRAFAPADLASRHESERFLAAVRDRIARLTEAMAPHARHLARIHGPLPEPGAAAALRAEPAAPDLLAPLRGSEHGARLLDRVLALGQPFGCERSIKAAGGRLQADRFLLSLHRTALGLDPGRAVGRIAAELGLAAPARAEAAAAIAGADILHLGFEDGPGGPLYKLYVEWSAEADRRWRAGPEPGERPVLVHRAYKWSPLRAADPVVTLYHWPCLRGPDEIALRLEQVADATGGAFALGLAREILAIVRARGSGLPHYLEASEEPGPRLSYDLNLYATGLTVAAVEEVMGRAFAALGVPAAEAGAALAARRGETLGHVAAGLGRDGAPFVTLYSGVRGQDSGARGQER
ncbi:tryptophan halogenase [Methylobacterium currus]|uniref:Tryptophan halogenase n=1 Tax=Methylobacterium currus TaxID=2051553 RepID=A0A2R4WJM2_9HYPH|nr:tryptophan 7-halogenase [Methylobacterium currus]AWB21743.1 tryptophan halogenase [Methylobacterium currus]